MMSGDKDIVEGHLSLRIWLIASGVPAFVHVSSVQTGPVLAVLAIAAGVLLPLGR